MRTDKGSIITAIPSELDEWRENAGPLEGQNDGRAETRGRTADDAAAGGPGVESRVFGKSNRALSKALLVVLAVAVMALTSWMVGRAIARGTTARPDAQAERKRSPARPALVLLRIQDSSGQTFRTGILSGSSGTVGIPGRPRLTLSPTLIPNGARVRIDTVGDDGATSFVGSVDLKSDARARLNQPFVFEIEWLPRRPDGSTTR
jgi:hypothetical protein